VKIRAVVITDTLKKLHNSSFFTVRLYLYGMSPSIPFTYKSVTGFLTTGHQVPTSYFVVIGGLVNGQFNLMSTGWKYYPNSRGYNDPGFEDYLKTLV